MKRKLIKQGLGGITLTLPIKWIRELNLDAGAEVEVNQTEQGILISSETLEGKKKTKELFIKKEEKDRLRTILSSLYRQGYDEIILNFETFFSLSEITKIVESLMGYIITEQTQKKVIIKNAFKDDFEEINTIISKMFITTTFFLKQSADYLSGAKIKEDELSNLRNSIIKLRDYCQRMINVQQFEKEKSYEYHLLVFTLEKIASNSSNLLTFKKKIQSSSIKELEEVINYLVELQKAFLKHDSTFAIALNDKIYHFKKKNDHNSSIPLFAVMGENLFTLSSRIVAILI